MSSHAHKSCRSSCSVHGASFFCLVTFIVPTWVCSIFCLEADVVVQCLAEQSRFPKTGRGRLYLEDMLEAIAIGLLDCGTSTTVRFQWHMALWRRTMKNDVGLTWPFAHIGVLDGVSPMPQRQKTVSI